MNSYFKDRANGPRTLPFPAWSDTPTWHEDLQCFAHGARYWPATGLVRLYLGSNSCTDMTGALFSVLTGGRDVRRVETFAGNKPDTIYLCDDGEWKAYLPPATVELLDGGDVLELPPTHEEQTPAPWLPKLPFARRPGTAQANERAQAKAEAAACIKAHLEKVRRETLAKLDERLDPDMYGHLREAQRAERDRAEKERADNRVPTSNWDLLGLDEMGDDK